MPSRVVVFFHPRIEIGLKFLHRPIDLLPEGDAIALVQHGLVELPNSQVDLGVLVILGGGFLAPLPRFGIILCDALPASMALFGQRLPLLHSCVEVRPRRSGETDDRQHKGDRESDC
jgi:hypothetical protein